MTLLMSEVLVPSPDKREGTTSEFKRSLISLLTLHFIIHLIAAVMIWDTTCSKEKQNKSW
jgi:hypothetical protein